MKDLGKAIEKLLKIDPSFEEILGPIKKKYDRNRKHMQGCWKEIIEALNSMNIAEHQDFGEIKKTLISNHKKICLEYCCCRHKIATIDSAI